LARRVGAGLALLILAALLVGAAGCQAVAGTGRGHNDHANPGQSHLGATAG
jgi:hypothetical protein